MYLHVFVFNTNAIFYDKDKCFIKMFVIELMINFIVYFCNSPVSKLALIDKSGQHIR